MTGLQVVLVRPQFPGNLGAVGRVMHNFGCTELLLVDPRADPNDPEARRMATRGEFILQRARRLGSLDEALRNCRLTAATSANVEGVVRRTGLTSVRELAGRLAIESKQGATAVVFGPEPHGLTTDEIDRCHYLMTIPANPLYPSLNLAQAVAIVLYEIWQAQFEAEATGEITSKQVVEPTHQIAPNQDVERALHHLRQGLEAIHFLYGPKADSLMHAIRHLIRRAQPSPAEVKILHGLARQLLWHAQKLKAATNFTEAETEKK